MTTHTPVKPPTTKAQMRAARALLDWSQETLAHKAGIGVSTVRDFEAGRREPRQTSIVAMTTVLETEGVMFLTSGQHQGALALMPTASTKMDDAPMPVDAVKAEDAPKPAEPAKLDDSPRRAYTAIFDDDDD
jgi:transcriptional regulator with XRE-family HTH domain